MSWVSFLILPEIFVRLREMSEVAEGSVPVGRGFLGPGERLGVFRRGIEGLISSYGV